MERTFAILMLSAVMAAAGCSQSTVTKSDTPKVLGDLNNNPEYPNTLVDTTGSQIVASLNKQDRQFVELASSAGAYEIASSQVAIRNSANGDIRGMAQHMIDDHTKLSNELTSQAKNKGLTATGALTPEQQKLVTRLEGLSGAPLDREYLAQQEKAHQEAIALFQSEQANGGDAGLRSFASDTVPTLYHHLWMVQEARIGTDVVIDEP